MDAAETIRNFIRSNMVIYDDEKSIELDDDDNIFTKGFVNSLFAMRLVSFIEQEFSISIDNEDLDIKNFSTVNSIVDFVEKKRGQ